MRFGLLGALEVTDGDGGRFTPTAPRLRTVLALLLMRPGALVTVAELVGELWGVAPPPTAANTVQVFVSRLRRLLAPACGPDRPDQLLRTWPGGYCLGIAPEQVDAQRFERLAGAGRRALAAGDAARSAAALRAALALWRGPALADVTEGEALRAYAAELGEEHLLVQEQRIEADLALARDRELVGELRTLTANHPLREAFWRQLLLALYRSGRRAEALDAYQRLRRLLVNELGVEPGGDVCRVHRAILAGDPPDQLVPAGAGERAVVAVAGSRLPADIADFTGRTEALAAIRSAIPAARLAAAVPTCGAVPVVAISGKAGCGKTTLAVHAAHLLHTAFPDGQLYAHLRGAAGPPVEPAEVLARFLRALGLDGATIPETVDERSELFRARLAGSRVLVVLDDAAGDAQVRPVLPGAPGCAVLVTSRGRLCGLEGVTALELPLFAPDEALELLRRVAGGERIGAELGAAGRIARLCGLLPLAVRVAGAKLAAKPHWSVGDLADRLADERRRLGELQAGDLDVRASIALSYQAGTPADRRTFRLLSLVPAADFPAWVVAALAGTDLASAESTVERLVDMQLVQAAGRGRCGQLRYQLHDLLRVYAAERLDIDEPRPEREAALDRLLGAYLDLARLADAALQPGRLSGARTAPAGPWPVAPRLAAQVSGAPLAWYATEHRALLTTVARAYAAGRWECTWALADYVAGFLELRTYWDDLHSLAALALDAARQGGSAAGEAVALRVRGSLLWDQSDTAAAADCYRRSVEILARIGARHDRAHALGELASLSLHAGRWEDGAAYLDECLPVFQELDDRRGLAYACRTRAMYLSDRGRPDEALEYFGRSLAYYRELGDRRWEAYVLLLRSGPLWRRRRLDEAAQSITDCLPILMALADHRWQAYALRRLGDVRRDQGRPVDARSCYRYALEVLERLGDRIARADTLRALAELCLAEGALAEARERLGESLAIFRDLGYARGQPFAVLGLSRVAAAEGRHLAAAALAEQALAAFRAFGFPLWEARALTVLGEAVAAAGDLATASGHWHQALARFRDLGSHEADRVVELLATGVGVG